MAFQHRPTSTNNSRVQGRSWIDHVLSRKSVQMNQRTSGRIQTNVEDSGQSSSSSCHLPECFPPKSGIPGGLSVLDIPQLVFFTFDDAVTPTNKVIYDRLFDDKKRKNPNKCPIRATFFNSHNWTIYSLVSDLYKQGHEFGSHSITHREPSTWWEKATIEQYKEEIVGQRNNIHRFASVPIDEIRSMRVPFLAMGKDNQFTMLQENNFTYDASMVSRSNPPSWPFTLQQPDKLTSDLCSVDWNDCPKRPYTLWELPLNTWYMTSDDAKVNCTTAMVDGCRPTTSKGLPSKEEAVKYLKLNFQRHYNSTTRPPFGINMHAAWFQFSDEYLEAMEEFVDELLQMKEVWIVPAYKVIEWIRTPTPLAKLNDFAPFMCTKN